MLKTTVNKKEALSRRLATQDEGENISRQPSVTAEQQLERAEADPAASRVKQPRATEKYFTSAASWPHKIYRLSRGNSTDPQMHSITLSKTIRPPKCPRCHLNPPLHEPRSPPSHLPQTIGDHVPNTDTHNSPPRTLNQFGSRIVRLEGERFPS